MQQTVFRKREDLQECPGSKGPTRWRPISLDFGNVPIRAMCYSQYERMKKFYPGEVYCYLDDDDETPEEPAEKCHVRIVSINQLVKWSKKKMLPQVEILIMDEFHNAIDTIVRGTIKNHHKVQVKTTLEWLITNANIFVCICADLRAEEDLSYIQKLRHPDKSAEDSNAVLLHYPDPVRDWNFHILSSEICQMQLIRRCLETGKNVAICCLSKNRVEELHKLLSVWFPDKRGLRLHADAPDKDKYIRNCNETWMVRGEEFHWVIYNAVLTYAVDFSRSHFHQLFAFLDNHTNQVLQVRQMLHRVRVLKDRCVYICCRLDLRSFVPKRTRVDILNGLLGDVRGFYSDVATGNDSQQKTGATL